MGTSLNTTPLNMVIRPKSSARYHPHQYGHLAQHDITQYSQSTKELAQLVWQHKRRAAPIGAGDLARWPLGGVDQGFTYACPSHNSRLDVCSFCGIRWQGGSIDKTAQVEVRSGRVIAAGWDHA